MVSFLFVCVLGFWCVNTEAEAEAEAEGNNRLLNSIKINRRRYSFMDESSGMVFGHCI